MNQMMRQNIWRPVFFLTHLYELPPVNYSVVKLSKYQMGIGGDDSWGSRPHPEYIIESDKKHEFRFTMCGVDLNEEQ